MSGLAAVLRVLFGLLLVGNACGLETSVLPMVGSNATVLELGTIRAVVLDMVTRQKATFTVVPGSNTALVVISLTSSQGVVSLSVDSPSSGWSAPKLTIGMNPGIVVTFTNNNDTAWATSTSGSTAVANQAITITVALPRPPGHHGGPVGEKIVQLSVVGYDSNRGDIGDIDDIGDIGAVSPITRSFHPIPGGCAVLTSEWDPHGPTIESRTVANRSNVELHVNPGGLAPGYSAADRGLVGILDNDSATVCDLVEDPAAFQLSPLLTYELYALHLALGDTSLADAVDAMYTLDGVLGNGTPVKTVGHSSPADPGTPALNDNRSAVAFTIEIAPGHGVVYNVVVTDMSALAIATAAGLDLPRTAFQTALSPYATFHCSEAFGLNCSSVPDHVGKQCDAIPECSWDDVHRTCHVNPNIEPCSAISFPPTTAAPSTPAPKNHQEDLDPTEVALLVGGLVGLAFCAAGYYCYGIRQYGRSGYTPVRTRDALDAVDSLNTFATARTMNAAMSTSTPRRRGGSAGGEPGSSPDLPQPPRAGVYEDDGQFDADAREFLMEERAAELKSACAAIPSARGAHAWPGGGHVVTPGLSAPTSTPRASPATSWPQTGGGFGGGANSAAPNSSPAVAVTSPLLLDLHSGHRGSPGAGHLVEPRFLKSSIYE